MPQFTQATATFPGVASDVLVGAGHLVVDRPLAAAATFLPFTLLLREGGYWRPSTAARVDAPAWVANTATAVGRVVRPATRPVTVVSDTQTLDNTGKVTLSGNTGDGTVTAVAAASARAGLYTAVCVAAASAGGTFRLLDPTGRDLGTVPVGTATALGGLTLTIADGSADWDAGDLLYVLVEPLHAYQASLVAGDTKTHASTEPTWPTDGSTVTDDQVTWTDLGAVDDLRDAGPCGVLAWIGADVPSVTTGAAEHPTFPVILTGQVRRALLAGVPAAYTAGDHLGLLVLEA